MPDGGPGSSRGGMLARAGLELIPLTELAKATKAARKAAARHRGIAAQATHKRRRENAQAALVGEPERGERLQQEPPREPPGAAAASADGADDAALGARPTRSRPGVPLRTKNPFAKAALLARYTYGLPSFGAHRWAGKTIYLPRGIVPPGMLGPPAREAELYGSELRLRSGKRLEPRPVAEWTLRALQGAFLDDPTGPCTPSRCNLPGGGEVDTRFIQEVLRAQGALCHGLKPLPPGLPGREVRKHDAVMGRGTFTRLVLGGELAAAHLPDLFWDAEGAAIKRVAAVVACGSVAMPFASKGKPHDNAELAALETGSLDVMRAKLAELEREGWLAQAEEKPEPKPKKKKTKKKKKGGHGCGTEEQEGVRGDRVTTGCQRLSATVPTPVVINKQFGPDTNANRRLHLFNWYLAGLLEYLIAAFSIVNLRAACQMAQISLRLLEQQPYNYGFWAMQWMNGPDKITDPHRDVNDAREGYAALIYFHPDGDRDRRLHRLRFPALGISVELRHGDVVFIKGHYLKHGVVEDDDTEGRYCIVLTLGNNLKVNSEGASPNAP
eukprot:tig00000179_g13066.t1